ncbi:MAG TPA: dihydrolipoamide acetyltransferase family protein [Bacillota bacterium]|jgi:pyruvate dehydrogenase E2 component (dihydrolipoamide acetyltransferase)|nr:2-oxo acid dehydrogenase subunit E2 [Clostridiales bacterium UBA9856]HOA42472.1 dihydrolipoamide acetyltransferase family protein [Bacillota bacterium]HPZ60282.1 dihydrolipoamide acetyltransferase family protein [Bacillota bacterium]HQC82858.1 dihydrolipoamide acetyltransferase family protein [Bacillota bacterium]
MAELIIMPKLGFNMNEGKLVKWYKSEGDAVKKGEPLFSVETDKTNIDIEATCDGYVRKLFIDEGDKLAVTLPIAIVAGKEENIDALIADAYAQLGKEAPAEEPAAVAKESTAEKAAVVTVATAEKGPGRHIATPRARRVAEEMGIDLASADIVGTGFEGGICEKDVLQYAASAPKVRATPLAKKMAESAGVDISSVAGTGVAGKVMKKDVEGALASPEAAAGTTVGELTQDGKEILEKVPYAGVRRIIGERLSSSMFSAPHVFFTQKVNLEKLLELRKQVNESQDKKTSVTDYIAKAVILTLQKYPDINASLVGDTIEKYKSVNLGIAVAAPSGLIVPVIKNSQNMSVVEISEAASDLIEKAREGKLTPDEYSGGTFTISNLGMFGIYQFTAIINPPESGILAVSAAKDEPVVVTNEKGEKEIAIKPMMNITLSVDHRVIDGLLAAQAVAEIKALLEQPVRLFL